MTNEIDNIKSQMRKGILEYCVLIMLSHRKSYPSDIIKAMSETNLMVVEGTIYTLLNRLRREGKLDYEWQESPKGPPRKYFFITDSGRESLLAMDDAWTEINAAVAHFRDDISDTAGDEDDTEGTNAITNSQSL